MSEALKNPELPLGAIVETYEDGGALRNDGVKLTPASQNPWYVLATVAGEQEGIFEIDIDHHLHAKNRRFWNGWMCQGMEAGERAALAEKLRLPEAELAPLSAEQKAVVKTRFETAFPDKAPEEMIPAPDELIDFQSVYFLNPLVLNKCYFPANVVFQQAHLSGAADFLAAHLTKSAFFQAVHFANTADFRVVYFDNDAHFQASNFIGNALF